VQLPENRVQVPFHRLLADVQVRRDLLVSQPPAAGARDLLLSPSEVGFRPDGQSPGQAFEGDGSRMPIRPDLASRHGQDRTLERREI
jgi:hypothetical protein